MRYEVIVEGTIGRHWSVLFDGVDITTRSCSATQLTCDAPDQAALHGVLARLRDTGLVLVSVTRVDPDHEEQR